MIVHCSSCKTMYFVLISSDMDIKMFTGECPKCGAVTNFDVVKEYLRGHWRVCGGTEHK